GGAGSVGRSSGSLGVGRGAAVARCDLGTWTVSNTGGRSCLVSLVFPGPSRSTVNGISVHDAYTERPAVCKLMARADVGVTLEPLISQEIAASVFTRRYCDRRSANPRV